MRSTSATGHHCSDACPAAHEILPGLFLGSLKAAADPELLAASGIQRVVCVGASACATGMGSGCRPLRCKLPRLVVTPPTVACDFARSDRCGTAVPRQDEVPGLIVHAGHGACGRAGGVPALCGVHSVGAAGASGLPGSLCVRTITQCGDRDCIRHARAAV